MEQPIVNAVDRNSIASVKITKTKTVAITTASILLFAAALLLWKQQLIDNGLLVKCNYFFEETAYLSFFELVSRYGMGTIALLFSGLIFLSLKRESLNPNHTLFMFVVISFALSSVVGDLMKEVLDRARPVAELGARLAQTELSGTPSFPSGHAAKSMGLALPFVIMASNNEIITRLFKVGVLLIAALVCFSRIALQKHYLSDVLAGVAVALFFVVVAVPAVNYLLRRRGMDGSKLVGLNKRLAVVYLLLAAFLTTI